VATIGGATSNAPFAASGSANNFFEVGEGGGSGPSDAAFICHPNYISSRHEGNIVYITRDPPQGTPIEYWIKSHAMYPIYDYPLNLDCFVSFKTVFKSSTQHITFEIVQGSISGDAFIAFGNDYGDTETYNIVDGVTKTIPVDPNKENRRRIMFHFNTGSTSVDSGFLAKISVV